MKIIVNPNEEIVKDVREKLKEKKDKYGEQYCPCVLPNAHNKDTICPCKNFRESKEEGSCHCGLFIHIKEVGENNAN